MTDASRIPLGIGLRVEAITRDFEKRFRSVMRWNDPSLGSPEPPSPRMVSKEYPFRTFRNGIEVDEGAIAPPGAISDSAEGAVVTFAKNMLAFPVGPTDVLYWRKRPELESDTDFETRRTWYSVYCRLAVAPLVPERHVDVAAARLTTGEFRVLIDYGAEGMKFWDKDGYGTLGEAVAAAIKNSYGNRFMIVREVHWQVSEIENGAAVA